MRFTYRGLDDLLSRYARDKHPNREMGNFPVTTSTPLMQQQPLTIRKSQQPACSTKHTLGHVVCERPLARPCHVPSNH